MTRRVLLGRIAGAHGVRGEVRIRSFTAEPASIVSYGPLADEPGTREFKLLLRGTVRGDELIARIEGVDDRNAAEALRGTELYVDRDRLPPIENASEYYEVDLIGLEARSTPTACARHRRARRRLRCRRRAGRARRRWQASCGCRSPMRSCPRSIWRPDGWRRCRRPRSSCGRMTRPARSRTEASRWNRPGAGRFAGGPGPEGAAMSPAENQAAGGRPRLRGRGGPVRVRVLTIFPDMFPGPLGLVAGRQGPGGRDLGAGNGGHPGFCAR